MHTDPLKAYAAMDRLQALAQGLSLSESSEGCAAFTDISGFTPLTEALVDSMGEFRGAEELASLLNRVYDALITEVHRYRGSVIGFSGDGMLSWFDGDPLTRAVAASIAMREALAPLASVEFDSRSITLSIKTALAAGRARRLLVGDPKIQQIDVLAGETLDRLARVGRNIAENEILLDESTSRALSPDQVALSFREDMAVVREILTEVPATPWPAVAGAAVSEEILQSFVPGPVYARLAAGQGEFLAELRPSVAVFIRIASLNYDEDEAAGEKLDAYVRWVQAVLARYDGYLLEISTGDKGTYLYASFGALAAHGDDSSRAVGAAMQLRQVPSELAFAEPIQIGLSQGRVRAGAYGGHARRAYGALGDEVVLAARLMEAAPEGNINCSGHVSHSARGQWVFEPVAPVHLKGKSKPVPVYRPLGKASKEKGEALRDLVGRDAELQTLVELLAAVRSGHRRVVVLEGEAGIGKSRLLDALSRIADDQGFRWLRGAGQATEQQTAYGPWRDIIMALLEIDETKPLIDQQRHIQEHGLLADDRLKKRVSLLNDILDLDLPETALTRSFDPKLRHESLNALVVELLRAATQHAPLIFVLEDAHWADSLSWALMLSTARSLRGCSALAIIELRPVDESAYPERAMMAGLDGAEVICLSSLAPDAIVAVAAARLGVAVDELPPDVAALIRERAGGNPFFAEEMADTLLETETLTVHGKSCRLNEDLKNLTQWVPDTVEGIVLGRIDRLPAQQQLVMKAASVIGRSFEDRVLMAIHPAAPSERDLLRHLEDLTVRNMTVLERIEPTRTFAFRHAIARQVAYDTLLFSQRRELHRAAALWYEVSSEDEEQHYALLFHHWDHAEDEERTHRYAKLAGDQAASRFANKEAADYLSRALELTAPKDLEEQWSLLQSRFDLYELMGRRKEQEEDLNAMEDVAASLGDDHYQVEVTLLRARYADARSDYKAAIEASDEAAQAAMLLGDVKLEASAHLVMGGALLVQGEAVSAQGELERALDLAQRADAPVIESHCLRNLGRTMAHLNSFEQAVARYTEALELARLRGDRRAEAMFLRDLGVSFIRLGRPQEARESLERSLQIEREIGHRRGEAMTLGNLGVLAGEGGDAQDAERYFGQTLEIQIEVGDRWGEAMCLSNLGVAAADRGDEGAAMEFYEAALEIWKDIKNRDGAAITLSNLSSIYARCGSYEKAAVCGDEALRLCRETGNRWQEALTIDCRGILAFLQDRFSEAAEDAEQALAIAREIGARSLEAWALTNLGNAMASLGKLHEADDAFQAAREIRIALGEYHLVMGTLAGWARAALQHGDTSRALKFVEEYLTCAEEHFPHEAELDPFGALSCFEVLDSVGDPRAQGLLTRAYESLQMRAARISDETLRHSYLKRVCSHRRIVELWEKTRES